MEFIGVILIFAVIIFAYCILPKIIHGGFEALWNAYKEQKNEEDDGKLERLADRYKK